MKLFRNAISCSLVMAACGYTGNAGAEQNSTIMCRSGVLTSVAKIDDMLVYTIEHRGIILSQDPGKAFDSFTQHCVGSAAVVQGKYSGGGFCRNVDPATGDFVLLEWTQGDRAGAGTYKFIGGTGKWKGITGNGEYQLVQTTRPVTDGTYQNCVRTKDTYTVPKP